MLDSTAEIKKTTWVGMLANVFLAVVKVACGIVGGSQVLIADGIHSFSDLISDFAILIGIKYWVKPADDCHPHGHYKVEVLVTAIIGIILACVATTILYNSITTLKERHNDSPGFAALIAAVMSIIIKEILYRWTASIGFRIKSMPLVANAWHHRSDALSSIPVVIAVIVAMVKPEWAFVDHVGAIVVSIFIYHAAFKILFPALSKLLDSGVSDDTKLAIQQIVLSVEDVLGVHKIRSRYIGSSKLAIDLHVEVNKDMSVYDGHLTTKEVEIALLNGDLDIIDIVVHLEPYEGPVAKTSGR